MHRLRTLPAGFLRQVQSVNHRAPRYVPTGLPWTAQRLQQEE
jgi:hypothetical protein